TWGVNFEISNPRNNQSNCSSLNDNTASPLRGHLNLFFSNRLYHKAKPVLSQYKILILLRERLPNTNNEPEKVSSSITSLTRMLNPLIDCRKSTGSRCT